MIEYDHQVIRTPRTEYRAPSVIRLQHLIRRPRPRVKLSRREVFARDRHTCQYCGRQSHDLTLDHVVPRHRGGGHTWENLVAACKPCNHRKGGKTLEEARLRLHPAAVRAAQRHLLAVHAVPRRRAQRGLADVPVPGSQLTGRRPTRRRGAHDPGVRSSTCSRRSGRPATPRTSSAARCATSLLGRRPADWDLAIGRRPERVLELFPGAVYENRFGTVAVRATARPSRSRRSGATTNTPTSGGRTGSSSATRSSSTWPGATSRSTRWPGARGRGDDARLRRSVRRPIGRREPAAARRRRPAARFEEDALRMIRAVRLAATLGFAIEAATLAGDPGARRARRATCRASGSPPSSTSCSPRRARRSGSG